MIRADLHIHTLATPWDEPFEFDFEQLRQHVLDNKIDVIAVTNHNAFDRAQYREVAEKLRNYCTVYPGVEVSALDCHILVVVDPSKACDLEDSCADVQSHLGEDVRTSLSLEQFKDCFPFLDEAIVIPHFGKNPTITSENLVRISRWACALEVSSLSKAIRLNKLRPEPLPAVFFTDYRFGCELGTGERTRYRPGGVYLRAASGSFPLVKAAINYDDLFLSSTGLDGDLEFAPGVSVSSGVNLVLGKRSTGKSFSLKRIAALCDGGDAYFIEQGELVSASLENEFYSNLDKRFANVTKRYLEPWGSILEDAIRRGNRASRRTSIRTYLSSLKKHAETSMLSDVYSKCRLFRAKALDVPEQGDTKDLINAVSSLLSSSQHECLIDQVVGRVRLVGLLELLSKEAREVELERLAVSETNRITTSVKNQLKVSSVEQMPDPEIEQVFDDEAFFQHAAQLLEECWKTKKVCDDEGRTFSKYSVIATRKRFGNANSIKEALSLPKKGGPSFSGATVLSAADYIDKLLSIDAEGSLTPALFDVEIGVRDEKGAEPSGGQRTECVFLGRLAAAAKCRFILIDEPESSFDNPFLNGFISAKIRELANHSTVVVATHNQVLGLALKPNKLLLTSFDEETKRYSIASGGLRDRLFAGDGEGKDADAREVVIDILEAGRYSYEQRRSYYEGA